MSLLDRFRPAPAPAAECGVLMVCLGNICRSPMAEGVLRSKLARVGLDRRVRVESAGTHGEPGLPPDVRAAAAAQRRGYDLSRIRSRRVLDDDFERFDLVFAMDTGNHDALLERCPNALSERVHLLLDFAPRPDQTREIPDPYYGAAEGFEAVLDLIEPACDAIARHLAARLLGPV